MPSRPSATSTRTRFPPPSTGLHKAKISPSSPKSRFQPLKSRERTQPQPSLKNPDFQARLTDLQELLLLADSRDDIIEGCSGWLKYFFSVTVFLTIKKSQAVGFYMEGSERSPDEIKDLVLSLNLTSACRTAIEDHQAQYGDFADDTAIGHMAGFFNLEQPLSTLVVPVILKGKPVGLLVGLDAIEHENAPAVEATEWSQVKDTISAAFESFILNKKLGV